MLKRYVFIAYRNTCGYILNSGGYVKDKLNTDVILKEFWRNNERFADLFNTFLFNNERILQPDCLQELDTDVSTVIELKGHAQTISRMRDLLMERS